MTAGLTVATRSTGAALVLELSGELDHDSAPGARAVVAALVLRPGQLLVIDLAGLTFCDSTGITVMVAARRMAESARAGIVLAAVPDRLARIFAVVGLDQVFITHPTSQDALAAWTAPEP